MMNDSVVYIEKYDKTLDSDQFDLAEDNNVLIICASLAGASDEVGKFSAALSYVTVVCLGVSITCLLLHQASILPKSISAEKLSGKFFSFP
jgi:hypothetical protein